MNSKPFSGQSERGNPNQSRRGTAAVELALVMPFLMILTLGICELGQAYRIEAILCEATRAGCTTGTRPGCSNADVISDIQAVLSINSVPVNLATVTILVNGAAGDVASADLNDQITVTVSVPTQNVVITTTVTYLTNKTTLSQSTSMMKQG